MNAGLVKDTLSIQHTILFLLCLFSFIAIIYLINTKYKNEEGTAIGGFLFGFLVPFLSMIVLLILSCDFKTKTTKGVILSTVFWLMSASLLGLIFYYSFA